MLLLEMIAENPIATMFGGMGLVCQLTWPLMRTRSSILIVQFGIGAFFAIQYASLGAWAGVGICSLGATQTAVAFLAGGRAWIRHMGYVFLPLVGVVGIVTWQGAETLMACTACSLVMTGRMQQDTIALRWFLLAAAPMGISYDIVVGAPAAAAGAILSAVLAARMLQAEVKRRREVEEDDYFLSASLLV